MIIQINEPTRSEIADFLPQFRAATDQLRETTQRLTDIGERSARNEVALAELTAAELPTDKEISQRLICRERSVILSALAAKHDRTATEQRSAIVPLAHDAGELVRRAASQSMFAQEESALVESLPETIRADKHLLFRIVGESQGKQAVGRFLNPPTLTPRHDSEEIVGECDRRAQLLDDLLSGRDIAVPGAAALA